MRESQPTDLEEEVGVPYDDEERLGPRDGHVEPLGVAQESQLVAEVVRQELLLRAHSRHDDHLPLLAGRSSSNRTCSLFFGKGFTPGFGNMVHGFVMVKLTI